MTASRIELEVTAEDRAVARMTAAAVALALAESALPSPLPGVKPGLANIVTLVVLARHGWAMAAWVSLLRVLVASLLLGSFLSPGFVLSLAGALMSLVVLRLATALPRRLFGPITQSLLAAFAHIGAQLAVVYWWLIPSPAIIHLLPVFAAAAWLFGLVNGIAAARLLGEGEPQADAALVK